MSGDELAGRRKKVVNVGYGSADAKDLRAAVERHPANSAETSNEQASNAGEASTQSANPILRDPNFINFVSQQVDSALDAFGETITIIGENEYPEIRRLVSAKMVEAAIMDACKNTASFLQSQAPTPDQDKGE